MKKYLVNKDKEHYLSLKSKCIFSENLYSYIRDEKDGYITIIPTINNINEELIINPTCKKVIDLANGKNTIGDIYNSTDLINTLFDLTNYNLLEWDIENPFTVEIDKKVENYKLKLATEDDLLNIVDFIKNNDINYYVFRSGVSLNKRLYNLELEIRQKMFSLTEEFFIIERNSVIDGLLSLSIPVNLNSTASRVEFIKCRKNDIGTLFEYAIDTLKEVSVEKITKISVDIANNIEAEDTFNILRNLRFETEGILKKEFNDIDIARLSYIY